MIAHRSPPSHLGPPLGTPFRPILLTVKSFFFFFFGIIFRDFYYLIDQEVESHLQFAIAIGKISHGSFMFEV